MRRHRPTELLLALSLLLLAGCMSLRYDLADVPGGVSAKPAPAGSASEPFELERKQVLWIHGLAGRTEPDVGALVAEHAGDASVARFRVRRSTSFHDWLVTHLSLSLVRVKTVVIEGEIVR